MIVVRGLHETLDKLAKLDLASTQVKTLHAQAERLAEVVRESISHPPGSDHATPWRQSGTLHESIGVQVSEEEAVVGSTDQVAVFQENGTRNVPPRPFLAPAAAAGAEQTARAVGEAIAAAIREALQ